MVTENGGARMSIRIVQLGSSRHKTEGIRIGTVRRPPRGILKKDHARLDFYDVWLPELAPSESLLQSIRMSPDSQKNWQRFMLRYAREMERPPAVRILNLLALLSHTADFSVGCYCPDESQCHRSILRALLKNYGASIISS
jgi:uncharacterized protein YeaO (DUF488 family)